jgi:hypothetical protein
MVNIYNFLSTLNNGYLIAESRKVAKSRYFALENSPLTMAEAETGKVLMDALLLPKNWHIVERFNLNELQKILELPVNIEFFDNLITVDESFTGKQTLRSDKPFSYKRDLCGILRSQDRDQVNTDLFYKHKDHVNI